MISIQSAIPAHRRTGRSVMNRLFLVVLLAAVLAACQSTPSVLHDDEVVEETESLAIIVSPIAEGSGDLEGQTVDGTVVVSIAAAGWMREVRFLVDGQRRHMATSAPFQYELDTTLLADGPHVLVVEARMANGRLRGSESAAFVVSNAPEPVEPDPGPEPEPVEPEPVEPEPVEPEPVEPEPVEPDPEPEPGPTEPPAPPLGAGRGSFSLLGDEGFFEAGLGAVERLWFSRTWAAVEASSSSMVATARRDDVYYFGRTLFEFSTAVLLGLRSTGDLRFLDALDPVMQALRGELYDGWCGGVATSLYVNSRYGTVSEPDGFRNFRLRDGSDVHGCRDTGDLNETLTHGHLAMVMYAYHVNRDLVSPAGVDYGERADFWFEYLRNDFEAKWRQRSGVAWPAMDFIDLKFSHTYNVFMLYYYFMGRRLVSVGDADGAAYLAKAASLTDAVFDQRYVPGERGGGFVEVSGPTGDAVVYSFGAPGRGAVSSTHLEASPMTYSRYVMSALLTLRLEGLARWDDAAMMRLANGLTGFVIDIPQVSSSGDSLAASVTGESTVGGIPPTTFRSRMSVGKWALMSAFAVWDASGRIEEISLQTYGVTESDEDRPSNAFIPAGMLFVERATGQDLGLTASR